MPRVAALYDVHGNLPALEAVLAEAAELDVIVAGGDVVGGAFPGEAVKRLRAEGDRVRWLRGNAERELVEVLPPREAGPPPGERERLLASLTAEQVDFLYGLPERVELEVQGLGHVLFCHATPQNDLDMVTPLTPEERLRRILDGVGADVVVAGHTHIQEDRRVGGVRWVNAAASGCRTRTSRAPIGRFSGRRSSCGEPGTTRARSAATNIRRPHGRRRRSTSRASSATEPTSRTHRISASRATSPSRKHHGPAQNARG